MARLQLAASAALLLTLLAVPLRHCLAQQYEPDAKATEHYRAAQRCAELGRSDPKQYAQAVEEMQAAVEVDGKWEDGWYFLAQMCDKQRADKPGEAARAWRKVYDMTSDQGRKDIAEKALIALGENPNRPARKGRSFVYLILVILVIVAVAVFLLTRRKEEAAPVAPTISLDFGTEKEPEDLGEVLAEAPKPAAPARAPARKKEPAVSESDQILTDIDEAPATGPRFEELVMRIGAAALTDAKVIEAVADKLLPYLSSSDRARRLKAFRILANFEGESARVDSALQSFDRSGFTDEELGV